MLISVNINIDVRVNNPKKVSSPEKRTALNNVSKGTKETQVTQAVRRSTRVAQNRKQIKDKDLFKNQILDLSKLLKKISSQKFSLTQENPSQERSTQSTKASCKEKRSSLKRKHEEISKLEDTGMEEIIKTLKKLKIEDPSENTRIKRAEETKKKVEAVLTNYEFLRSTSSLEVLKKELHVMLSKINPSLVGIALAERIKLNLLYCLDVSFEEEELGLLSMKANIVNKYSKISSSLSPLVSIIVDRVKECIDDPDEIKPNYPWD